MPDQPKVPAAIVHQIPRWNVEPTPAGGVMLTINDPGLVTVILALERGEAQDMAAGLVFLTTPE